MRSTTNKEFESFHPKAFFSHYHFCKKIEIVHQLLYLLYLDNNRFENIIKRAFKPIGTDISLNYLYS